MKIGEKELFGALLSDKKHDISLGYLNAKTWTFNIPFTEEFRDANCSDDGRLFWTKDSEFPLNLYWLDFQAGKFEGREVGSIGILRSNCS